MVQDDADSKVAQCRQRTYFSTLWPVPVLAGQIFKAGVVKKGFWL